MLFNSLLRKSAYLLALIVVLFAIMVSVSRMLLPLLDTHHADIEKWTSQLLDRPVNIGRVHLSWYGYQPLVSLDNVTVLDKETSEPILQVQRVGVFFSIPRSIWNWKPVPSGLLIAGADIKVRQTSTGEYLIQGFPAIGGFDNQPFSKESKFAETLAWLSEQHRLILRDIDIRYTGLKGEKRFVTLHDLSLVNSALSHLVQGKAILHQDVPTEVSLTIDWDGDPLDLPHIKAKAYLYVSGLSLSQWFKEYIYQGWNIKEGVASAKIWVNWEKGSVQRLQTVFQLYGFHLYSQTDKSTYKIRRLSGDFGWRREGDNYIVAADDLLVDMPSHLWPATSFSAVIASGPDNTFIPKSLKIGYLDMEEAQKILFSSPLVLPLDVQKKLLSMQLKGSLHDISLEFPTPWNDWQQIKAATGFKHVYFLSQDNIPGVANLAGDVKWNGHKGEVSLNSHQLVIQYPTSFNEPLAFDQLSGGIRFHHDINKAWLIQLASLQVLSKDAAANISGSISIPETGSVVTDLNANFTVEQAKRIKHYLPMKIFEPGLVEWLKKAFLSGEVKSGQVVIRGAMNDFPFDKNNGEFLITAETNRLDLHYAPDWPLLEQIDAKLVFSGRKIEIDVHHAKLLGMPVQKAHGLIPYLGEEGPAILEVQANDVEADFAQGLQLIRQSPLKDTLGKMFSNMSVTGPIKVQLDLKVPLSNPENVTINGNMAIQHALLDLTPWGLALTDLSGDVHFTEKTTDAKNLHGALFGKPIEFDLATIEKAKVTSIVQARFKTNLAVNDLESWLKMPLSKVAKGAANVTGEIDLSTVLPIDVRIKSDLGGIALDLPDPYAKKAENTKSFSAQIIAQEKKPLQAKILYGDLLGAALILEKKKEAFHLTSVNLRLGTGDPAWPTTPGLMITGSLNELNWDRMKDYMTGSGGAPGIEGLAFNGADVQFNKLEIFGKQLGQTRIQLAPANAGWTIKIESQDIAGQLQVPKTLTPKGQIVGKFDRFNMKDVKPSASTIDVSTLPALWIILNNVNLNDMRLGQVTIKTIPAGGGQTIQTLKINSPRINFQSSGTWTNKGTHLKGAASSAHLDDFLESLGIDARNFVANQADLDFDLNWNGPFYAPAVSTMVGSAELELGPGRIVDIGQDADAKMGIGRMLSLFSLQTIPRRLSLDFSDVFQKGYSFDMIKGNFTLKNGSAYTQNLHFKGPVARLDIVGRIGLRDKDFDLTLGVTPMDVTSGIPIAAAYLTGPVGGLAALAVNTMIGRQISKAATYHYDVRGPWTNYTIELQKAAAAR